MTLDLIQPVSSVDPLQELKDLVSPLDPVEIQKKVDLELPVAKEHLRLHRYHEAFDGFKFIFANSGTTECIPLMVEMTKLATEHIPARTAIKKWRDAKEKLIFSGKADAQCIKDWSDLNQCLGETEHTLKGYHKLKDKTGVSKEISEAIAWTVWKELVRVRRYEEIGDFISKLESMFLHHIKEYDAERETPRHGTPTFEAEAYSLKSLRLEAIRSAAPIYEIAVALGKHDIANEIIRKVTAIDTSDHVYCIFITSAIRAGADDEAGELFEQAKTHNDLFSLKESINAMRKAKI